MNEQLGHIVSGSLIEGLTMRVSSHTSLEQLKTGKFVSIHGGNNHFFCLITNVSLEVTHPDILLFPPTDEEPLLKDLLRTKDIYATATLRPMLTLTAEGIPAPVKTVPPHFAPVKEATAKDIAQIFGDEKDSSKRYFTIGNPLDMDASVCIDLEKLTERSNGIFGKTGTGKTFLTRLVLAGLIHHDKAVNIIFDMHSEYGLQARKEGNKESFVKGLKTLFPDKVAIFSLDPASTRRRGGMADVELTISYHSIAVEDIISLDAELNLNPTAYEAAYLISAKYKQNWLEVFLRQGDSLKEFAQEIGAHPESLAALYRKLKAIDRLPFITSSSNAQHDVITQMMEYIERGTSIVIEFGNFTSTFCYLLVANIITRRLHALYIKKTEQFLGSQRTADEPKKLMITIEEAHKFLNPQAARQTIFGTIAREMRKYYVSLLVVDQRPSGIDPEVLSQIGTKIVAQLNDEKDIAATLNGVNNANQLRTVLGGLETKKQVILLGHAIAMPVVIQTREYDEKFYKAMMNTMAAKPIKELIEDIF
jgi:DNA helicase HerA-like ATPase